MTTVKELQQKLDNANAEIASLSELLEIEAKLSNKRLYRAEAAERELASLSASSEAKDFDIQRLLECMKGIRSSLGLPLHEVMDVLAATCVPAEVEHNLRESRSEESKALAEAIVSVAVALGITDGLLPLTGPQCLLLASSAAEEISRLRASSAKVREEALREAAKTVCGFCAGTANKFTDPEPRPHFNSLYHFYSDNGSVAIGCQAAAILSLLPTSPESQEGK